ncbi:MAG: type II toxin-antitoxin system Phd/YefM family antitoxin [Desulfuromonadales bacterium]|nr:type II toxin-antitoxin system Phd/YefM family antitoxin [Desulfuromonadales bacterium]
MRSLSVSSARSQLPSLLDDVLTKHETIIISRKGKPVAQLTPIPADAFLEDSQRFPLRSIAISIADDFDEPAPEVWEALES